MSSIVHPSRSVKEGFTTTSNYVRFDGKHRRFDYRGGSNALQNTNDPLIMQNFDNPEMVLVMTLLTDVNFLTWSRSIKRALAAKNKLVFINGGAKEPEKEPT